MADMPEVTKLASPSVNRPASGTYGEKAAADRLKQQLPAAQPVGDVMGPGPGAAPAPTLPGGGGPPAPMGAQPAGLPRGLLRPSDRPTEPVGAPYGGPADPYAGAVDARQRRLALLDMLSTHPEASPEVREWAEIAKKKLIARG